VSLEFGKIWRNVQIIFKIGKIWINVQIIFKFWQDSHITTEHLAKKEAKKVIEERIQIQI
jgi:hypothetical protein